MKKTKLSTFSFFIALAICSSMSVSAFARTKSGTPAKRANTATGAVSQDTADANRQVASKPKPFVRNYGMAGCGLGSVVMGKKGNQIFAATTNGTSYNQTFGISSGTINCLDAPEGQVAQKMDRFLIVNKAALAGDIARGSGETIDSLSSILGCGDSTHFNSLLQKNFSAIYPSEAVQPNEVTDSIITVIESDPELSKNCQKLNS